LIRLSDSGISIGVKRKILGRPINRNVSDALRKRYHPRSRLPKTFRENEQEAKSSLAYGVMCDLAEALIEGENDPDGAVLYHLPHNRQREATTREYWACQHENVTL
jgi:hypothetical protein